MPFLLTQVFSQAIADGQSSDVRLISSMLLDPSYRFHDLLGKENKRTL